MRPKLWVVICQFPDGGWEICDFADLQYVSTNFHKAHRLKNAALKL